MAERLVVLIENDPVLSERLRAVLAAYHLRVELYSDGNELSLRKDLEPALIILCIDPKRLGWTVCNKLKKAPQFRGVPLIVTSQEASEKDFEDHRKLRTRADEYLHKPFGVEILLEKVASLIGLDPPQMEENGIEEIPIDDAALIEEELLTEEEEDEIRVDREIAAETDAAFAAIGASDELAEPTAYSQATPVGSTASHDEIELSYEDLLATGVRGLTAAPASAAAAAAVDEPAQVPALTQPSTPTLVEELQRRLEDSERRVEELQRSLAERPSAGAGASLIREREYINLREAINKKDKEVLDLRDLLDSRERQILDARDKAREMERQHRDLDERLLEVEKGYVSARERIESLSQDKDRAQERERGLKVRLEDAQKKLVRVEDELVELKRITTQQLQRAEDELQQARAQHASELANQLAAHEGQVTAQTQAHQAATTALTGQHAVTLDELREQHAAALTALQDQHAAAVSELHQDKEASLRALSEQAAARLQQEQTAGAARLEEAQQQLQAEHAARTAEQTRLHEEALEQQRRQHGQQLAEQAQRQQETLTDQHRQELERLQQEAAQALVVAEQRLRDLAHTDGQEMERLRQQLAQTQAAADQRQRELVASHQEEMTRLQVEFLAARDVQNEKLQQHEQELAARQAALAELSAAQSALQGRHAELEGNLSGAMLSLETRDKQIAALSQRLRGMQTQLAQAYQRIKSDDGLVSRAKKALSIALTLLDESGAPLPAPPEEETPAS